MRILRSAQQGTKVAMFLLLALGLSSLLTLSISRSTYAERSLLGTVRCLVRTVLWVQCPTTKPTPTEQGTTKPETPQQTQSENPPASTPEKSEQPVLDTPMPPVAEKVELPEKITAPQPIIPKVTDTPGQGERMTDAEYLAYFNTYSPYAVAGAHDEAPTVPLQRSSEGWQVFGVAWYWWVVGILGAVSAFLSVKYAILRKSSVLSERS